ncbi:MAG TPA: FtsX-like permease family protein, partial [Acidobacteriota bacterium]|nr:FtsX-like permease family protein [Acidobacteriota bacterium]
LPLYLAIRNLLRHPGRNLLYILGVSITAALLLDMILLSGGLKISLFRVLSEMGWELRIAPRGTVPFETETQIANFTQLRSSIAKLIDAESIDGMLGTTVNTKFKGEVFTSFAAGIESQRKVLYTLISGKNITPGSNEILVNRYLATEKKIQHGDVLPLWIGSQEQTLGNRRTVDARVAGIIEFKLDAEGQHTMACELSFLQKVLGSDASDGVSIIMIKLKNPRTAEEDAAKINKHFPQVSAYTILGIVDALEGQLSYFRQFSYILGGISLVVTFVLVFIITTISFHDRIGEVALLRAIGISHKTIFSTVLLEGILTSLASAALGFALGKIVAIYLDSVLKSAPGLPADFSFFVFQPSSVLQALATLLITGFFAGLYPASAAVRLPVAGTLREEIL